jgi:hypothetical protein
MFLEHHDARRLTDDAPAGLHAEGLFLGLGSMPVEVAVFTANRPLAAADLRRLHDGRKGGRASPVVIVALHGAGRAALCADDGTEHALLPNLERGQAERICDAALRAPDRHVATRLLAASLQQMASPLPGVRNAGLFAINELREGVPRRADWVAACARSRDLLDARGRDLIQRLGFVIEATPKPVSILFAKGSKIAVAVFLERPDQIEPASEQFDRLSPVSFALAHADRENLDYVVVAAGPVVRIYPAKPGRGTAQRGRTETFVEINVALLPSENAGFLTLLASSDALGKGGSFDSILEASQDYAADLGSRLRDRIYEDVLPKLAGAIVRARRLRNPPPEKLAETYEMSLLVLFRLLFVAYAEDKELLPLHSNASYRAHSLKEIARRLAAERKAEETYGSGNHYWIEVTQLWEAVDRGNSTWHVPTYNGGLFATDHSPAATALGAISLADSAFAPALAKLLLDETAEERVGPIDFRSLGVREFGTIYEGLLEQELSVAETDLSVETGTGAYRPARRGAKVAVPAGGVYLHNASGARKTGGAYYTKTFAVEHLLEHAVNPSLDAHIARLKATYDDREASDQFFDFHVADIAMGSGHFLVAAVDHIEQKLSGYLAERALAGVRSELDRLRSSASAALTEGYRGEPIEDTQLLRRQIARRCVFGVDLNPLAVELARLSIWIHTFVPGLPLSFLDQNLVVGNSLVGIGTFDEARELLRAEADDLFSLSADEMLAQAREPMERLARLADATAAEVKEAQRLYAAARKAIRTKEELFTILTASRIDAAVEAAVEQHQLSVEPTEKGDLFSEGLYRKAEKSLAGLRVLHFPIAFPQVFLGRRPGFDVIIGNPPWEEATVEEDAFWARYHPGLRGLSQREQEASKAKLRQDRPDLVRELDSTRERSAALRKLLVTGGFPGMGTGDPDLYKAFCWRFWRLVNSDGGRIGVVLPRSAFAAKGSTEFRRALFDNAATLELTQLKNTGGWVFDDAAHQYTITLTSIERGSRQKNNLALDGPYASLEEFRAGRVAERLHLDSHEPALWNDTLSLPLLPKPESLDLLRKMRRAPRLDCDDDQSWRARPHTELHATNDKSLMDLESETRPRGCWPVFKGESFDLWTPDTGSYYGWADPKEVMEHLQEKRERSGRRAGSPFAGFEDRWLKDPRTLSCNSARIAFRDITRATDSRTMRASLLPPKVFLTNKAPFLLWPRGDSRDEAFLLGILSSIPLDWYARRFVEITMNFFILNPFPVPRPPTASPLRDRVVEISARLASPDDRFEEWAASCGCEPAAVAADEKEDLVAELDAAASRLYGLTASDVRHIFETFRSGWEYERSMEATLAHFKRFSALT